ncbi:hypothetical protein BCV70DRAFT_104364 [Testicularia cyperi]|uniref:Acyltransferase 3 domain-containing protein n=1 Tax=Testicularia cyperi TaxID=1882483 RepID=A0A317XQH7_9BASI|nr:hypothetical protein BCV70DRAFT_104364 [Testicularia cyperi]
MTASTSRFAALLGAAVALLIASSFTSVQAACECGYLDPLTNALWTDRTITYFNESGLNDVVTDPAESPRIYGGATSGETGTGQQAWSLVGDFVNKWENSFGATYRSAVSYNNTFIDNNSLALQVSPANLDHRIVNGSQIVTRRRDILYGSFRAEIQPAVSLGRGAAFKFGAFYNDSETVNVGVFTSNVQENTTLRWSWSAYGHEDTPVSNNISSLGTTDFLEHRFDWSPDMLQWRNAAANDSANFHAVERGVNASHLPSTASPVSFQAWANGESSQSQGPPLRQPLLTHVRYARFFFNSSLSERQTQFDEQCSAAGGNAICSTEDFTLRDSTEFDVTAALAKQEPAKSTFTAPLYGVIVISIAAGIFVLTIAHGLVVRRIKAQEKKRLAAIAAQEKAAKESQASSTSSFTDDTTAPVSPVDGDSIDDKARLFGSAPVGSSVSGTTTPTSAHRNATATFQLWNSPDLVYDSDSDSDDDNDDARSFSSASDIGNAAKVVLPRYGSSAALHQKTTLNGYDTPTANAAARSGGTETPRWIEDMKNDNALPYVAPGYVASRPGSIFAPSQSGHHGDNYGYDEIELSSHAHGNGFGTGASPSTSSHLTKEGLLRNGADSAMSSRFNVNNASMFDFQHEGTSRPGSVYESYAADSLQQPQIIRWQQRDLNAADGEIGALAQPELGDAVGRKARDGPRSGVKPPQSTLQAVVNRVRDLLFIKGTTQLTSTGARRIDYLDGMRGFACFLVSFHHFMLIYYFGITTPDAPHHYPRFEFWFRCLIGPLVVNQGLKLGIFFMLPSRTMTNRYLLKGGIQSMGDSAVRRIPRLALPVLGAVLANYFFMDVGAFKWVPRLASRTWSTWSYWQNFDNVMVFLDAFISLWWSAPPVSPALVTGYATGVLWTIPVIVQGTWTCMICALIAHEIKNPYKRFSFYALCISLSWYANTWDLFFMAGLVVADLDSKLNYQAKAAKGFPIIPGFVCRAFHLPDRVRNLRVHGQVFAWALFLAAWTQQYLSQIPTSPGRGFDDWDHQLHPNWLTSEPHAWTEDAGVSYTDPRVSAWVLSFSFFLLTDLSEVLRTFFKFRFWSYIGKHAFAVFLIHGVVFWTWSAWLCMAMLTAGVPYWATILVVFVTSYALLFLVCECFTRTFDSWGGTISKAVWRATSGGLGRKV